MLILKNNRTAVLFPGVLFIYHTGHSVHVSYSLAVFGKHFSAKHTDVNQVAFAVQHDVAVVPVFDLQQKEEQTVGSHAADEIIPRLVDTRAQAVHQDCIFTGTHIKQDRTQFSHCYS